jgi:MFS family permease
VGIQVGRLHHKDEASAQPMTAHDPQCAGWSPAPLPAAASGVRHLVLAGMTASVLVAYLPRTALGPAASSIKHELGFSDVAMGEILGVWAVGYLLLQLPGGWLGDLFGRRAMMPLYGLIWSLCTIGTAAATTYDGLWWSRLVFGMAQGGLIPCLTRACLDWFPADRRGTASAAITAGMSVGGVAATGLSAPLLPVLGWRWTLVVFALAGVAWAVGFRLIFRDRPERHPRVNKAELALIRGERAKPELIDDEGLGHRDAPGPVRDEPPPAGWADRLAVFTSLAFVMINAQAFCRAFCYAFFNSWFPSYLERAHGLHVASASALTMLPLAGYATGAMIGGPLIDGVLRRTGSPWRSRSLVGFGALVLAGLASLTAVAAAHPAPALVTLTLGAVASGFAAPATWAATMDVGGKWSSSVMAIGNMTGNLGAYLCPKAVGLILDAFPERWGLVLLMLAVVSILGGLFWLLVSPQAPTGSRRSIESRPPKT